MRGLYTSGVLDVFMEHGLYLPNVVGGQRGRAQRDELRGPAARALAAGKP